MKRSQSPPSAGLRCCRLAAPSQWPVWFGLPLQLASASLPASPPDQANLTRRLPFPVLSPQYILFFGALVLPSSELSVKRKKQTVQAALYQSAVSRLGFPCSDIDSPSRSSSFRPSFWLLSCPSSSFPRLSLTSLTPTRQPLERSISQSINPSDGGASSLHYCLIISCICAIPKQTNLRPSPGISLGTFCSILPTSQFSTLRDRLNHESSRHPSPVARPGLPFLLPF